MAVASVAEIPSSDVILEGFSIDDDVKIEAKNLPDFYGENPSCWLAIWNRFFAQHNITDFNKKMDEVEWYLQDRALDWFNAFEKEMNMHYSWVIFSESLMKEFDVKEVNKFHLEQNSCPEQAAARNEDDITEVMDTGCSNIHEPDEINANYGGDSNYEIRGNSDSLLENNDFRFPCEKDVMCDNLNVDSLIINNSLDFNGEEDHVALEILNVSSWISSDYMCFVNDNIDHGKPSWKLVVDETSSIEKLGDNWFVVDPGGLSICISLSDAYLDLKDAIDDKSDGLCLMESAIKTDSLGAILMVVSDIAWLIAWFRDARLICNYMLPVNLIESEIEGELVYCVVVQFGLLVSIYEGGKLQSNKTPRSYVKENDVMRSTLKKMEKIVGSWWDAVLSCLWSFEAKTIHKEEGNVKWQVWELKVEDHFNENGVSILIEKDYGSEEMMRIKLAWNFPVELKEGVIVVCNATTGSDSSSNIVENKLQFLIVVKIIYVDWEFHGDVVLCRGRNIVANIWFSKKIFSDVITTCDQKSGQDSLGYIIENCKKLFICSSLIPGAFSPATKRKNHAKKNHQAEGQVFIVVITFKILVAAEYIVDNVLLSFELEKLLSKNSFPLNCFMKNVDKNDASSWGDQRLQESVLLEFKEKVVVYIWSLTGMVVNGHRLQTSWYLKAILAEDQLASGMHLITKKYEESLLSESSSSWVDIRTYVTTAMCGERFESCIHHFWWEKQFVNGDISDMKWYRKLPFQKFCTKLHTTQVLTTHQSVVAGDFTPIMLRMSLLFGLVEAAEILGDEMLLTPTMKMIISTDLNLMHEVNSCSIEVGEKTNISSSWVECVSLFKGVTRTGKKWQHWRKLIAKASHQQSLLTQVLHSKAKSVASNTQKAREFPKSWIEAVIKFKEGPGNALLNFCWTFNSVPLEGICMEEFKGLERLMNMPNLCFITKQSCFRRFNNTDVQGIRNAWDKVATTCKGGTMLIFFKKKRLIISNSESKKKRVAAARSIIDHLLSLEDKTCLRGGVCHALGSF